MNLRESLRISWRNISGHKLRSTLTTLGVIIGIAAVVAFLTFGTSFKADVIGDVEADEEPELRVYTETTTQSGGFRLGQSPVFTERDVDALANRKGVVYASPQGPLEVTQLSTDGDTLRQFGASATTPDRFEYGVTFTSGGPFELGSDEAVINPQLNDRLGENLTAGDEVSVLLANGTEVSVEVAGVLNQSVQFTFGPAEPRIYLPTDPYYTTRVDAADGTRQVAYPFVQVRATGVTEVGDVTERVETYLTEESDARAIKASDYSFTVQTESEILGEITGFLDQITTFITGIAVIALLVGSIGIANIMLVSVTERTREIGVLKAVGATRRDVLQLFLVESVIIGVIGAVVGVVLGLLGAHAIASFASVPVVYPVETIVGAMLVGVVVGIVAGLYPAWRGATIDPIEALRYE